MQPQKLTPTTEVGCGLQKYKTFSEKRVKTLTILIKPNRAKQSVVERG
jgi:hypothetical protein